jgi:hypothetical protein
VTSQLPLFDLKIDLLDVARIKERILNSRLSTNTIRNYESAWKSFPPWCEVSGRNCVPATPETCIEFAAWCIGQGYRLETVFMRLKAIRYKHREANLPNPVAAEVQEFMRCAKRDLQERSGAKEALTPSQLLLYFRQALSPRQTSRPARPRDACCHVCVRLAAFGDRLARSE